MYWFNKDAEFNDNLAYFLHVVLNEVYLTKEEIEERLRYTDQFANNNPLADDLTEYFRKRLLSFSK